MFAAGRLLARNGDTMNTLNSPALCAADLLALARLDDDGAPPAASPPQPAGSQTEATGPARSQQARQAAPAGPGAGYRAAHSPAGPQGRRL